MYLLRSMYPSGANRCLQFQRIFDLFNSSQTLDIVSASASSVATDPTKHVNQTSALLWHTSQKCIKVSCTIVDRMFANVRVFQRGRFVSAVVFLSFRGPSISCYAARQPAAEINRTAWMASRHHWRDCQHKNGTANTQMGLSLIHISEPTRPY